MADPHDGLPDFTEDITPLPWPDQCHDLRATGRDWTSQVVLEYQRGELWGRIEGYRLAAQILVDHALKQRGDLNVVVFPFAACWRHHVELRLKALLLDLQRLLKRPPVQQRHHNILQLWNEVHSLILEVHRAKTEGIPTQSAAC